MRQKSQHHRWAVAMKWQWQSGTVSVPLPCCDHYGTETDVSLCVCVANSQVFFFDNSAIWFLYSLDWFPH